MPEKSYYNRLYAFQDEIMKIIHRQGVDFYLTGGTALSRCYLNHRYSDDLDFFINQAPDFKKQAQRKDVVDTLFIAKNFSFDWPEIIEEAKNKDLWVNPLDISRIIKEFPANLFDSIKWIIPVDQKVLDKKRLQMHDDIFYGRTNSLVE
ncbi:MAG: nucleotidyl transferase AbiEii/AbiGii toxin family protein [Deltaproteobacteria bacterium]|nr:nucleotidyl transferase AbiEii/AbiGii toxin family protein [Deltaproteobacteria bacterium]